METNKIYQGEALQVLKTLAGNNQNNPKDKPKGNPCPEDEDKKKSLKKGEVDPVRRDN